MKAGKGDPAPTTLAARLGAALAFLLSDPRVLIRYLAVGGSAALLELTLFTLLHEVAKLPLLVSNNLALGVAIGYSFVMQRHWTFGTRGPGALRQLRWYLFMQGISGLLNNLLMWAMVSSLGLYAPLAKIIQIGFVFAWNFTFCRKVVFRNAA